MSPSPSTPVNAELTIALMDNGTDVTRTYNLVCQAGAAGAGSNHPQAAEACAQLSAVGRQVLLTLPRKDQLCTQQYGGPQTALVTGTLDGTAVNTRFSLTDGCQIARWNAFDKVLGGSARAGV